MFPSVRRIALGIAATLLTGLAGFPAGPATVVSAQTPRPTFRSGIDMVRVSAIVEDAHGRPVLGLSSRDFELFDGGVARPIVEFGSDRSAITLAILVDSSGSMVTSQNGEFAREAVRHVLSWVAAGEDEVALYAFDTRLRVVEPFTTSPSEVAKRLPHLDAFGQTSLYDAIAETSQRLASGQRARGAVVVVTDGIDTSSVLTEAMVSRLVSGIDVPVYVLAAGARDGARSRPVPRATGVRPRPGAGGALPLHRRPVIHRRRAGQRQSRRPSHRVGAPTPIRNRVRTGRAARLASAGHPYPPERSCCARTRWLLFGPAAWTTLKEKTMNNVIGRTGILGLALVIGVSSACATKGYVKTSVAGVDTKVAAVSRSLEETQERTRANEARIGEVDGKAGSAKTAADGARQAADLADAKAARADSQATALDKASRRLVYTVVISEDQGNFAFGKTALPDDAKAALDELVTKIKANPQPVFFEIEGHTDGIGPKDFNERLGLERAEAVKRYLYDQYQIPLHKMNVISYGALKPVAPNETKAGRAARTAAS